MKATTLAESIQQAAAWISANAAQLLAGDDALATSEKKLGVKLPADVCTLWRLHDRRVSHRSR
jgi:cell wall assembly regulator SMI1